MSDTPVSGLAAHVPQADTSCVTYRAIGCGDDRDQRVLTPAEVAAYWRENADRWREIRRLGQCEPASRMPYLPSMAEGSERMARKRERMRNGATE